MLTMTQRAPTRRDEIFEFICEYARAHNGCSPNIRECAAVFGLGYTTIYHHITELVEDGRLEQRCGKLCVVGARWIRLPEGTKSPGDPPALVDYAKYQRVSSDYHRVMSPDENRAAHGNRRALLKGAEGKFTADDLALLRKGQAGYCWWCGRPMGNDETIDHRIPLARGGSNWPGNLVLCHGKCNSRKGARLPSEFGRLL